MLTLLGGRASGSAVPAMSFDALLTGADTVFRGEVLSVRPTWVESRDGRAISTLVVFRVDRLLKGESAQQIALEFFGGRIGDTTIEVVGVPRLRVGDRAVFFVRRNGRHVSPVVGFTQGRFPIQRDRTTGNDVVTASDGSAFASVNNIGAIRRIGPPVRTIRLADFELAIQQAVSSTLKR